MKQHVLRAKCCILCTSQHIFCTCLIRASFEVGRMVTVKQRDPSQYKRLDFTQKNTVLV
jgi:hypothetical protein